LNLIKKIESSERLVVVKDDKILTDESVGF